MKFINYYHTFSDNQKTFFAISGGTLIGFITSIIITRSLGPSGRGEYAVIMSLLSIFMAFSQFGLPEAMLFQVGKKIKNLCGLAINNFLFIPLVSLLTGTLFVIAYLFIELPFLENVDAHLIKIVFMILPFSLTILLFNRINQLNSKLNIYNSLNFINHLLFLSIILILLFFQSLNPGTILLAFLVSKIILAFITVFITLKSLDIANYRIDVLLLKESIINGSRVHWGMIIYTLGMYGDIFIINYFLKIEDVGYYSLAIGLGSYLKIVPEVFRTVLQSLMPKLSDKNDSLVKNTIIATRYVIIIMVILYILIIAFGFSFIKIVYGVAFTNSYVPLLIIIVGIIFQSIGQIIVSQLTIDGYLSFTSIAASLGAIIGIIFAWFLIPLWGLYGAAYSMVANHFITFCLYGYYLNKKNNVIIIDLLPTYEEFKDFYLSISFLLKKNKINS